MALQKIKSKSFKLKGEASTWAKKEKKSMGPKAGVKWETNRTKNTEQPWEAVLYKEIS